ncbi:hypothetical protein ACNAN0_04820 [Agrilactobacillus fermenti]|uniref:hypothetical protein n=1 Tax=Agrilactobacillus fermenti TaxID=2586909 RepID=UPI001E57EF8C|nr:hypothetical protein [Agrilactobacillus fermenti]MCD2256907.1 hypothetical protein [Agrilactobacillus fermenti]
MPSEIQQLLERYWRYFKRERNTLYWLLVVHDTFDQTDNFFLYHRRLQGRLLYSNELLMLPFRKNLYTRAMTELKRVSQLHIDYRDTRTMVDQVAPIKFDPHHGHH